MVTTTQDEPPARAGDRITAARGAALRCKGWRQEALLRMLENNLENAERPEDLVVYAGFAKAARDWRSYHAIVAALRDLEVDQTLVIQSGKPIGVFKTHGRAPLVLMANGNIVGRWATPENFYELADRGLTIWGGLTAADWQGRVLVSPRTQLVGDKFMARHFRHGRQHRGIGDTSPPQLFFDHFRALRAVFFAVKHA